MGSKKRRNIDHVPRRPDQRVLDQEAEVERHRSTLDVSLTSAVGPVHEFPNALNKILSEGRTEDAEKLRVLTRSIARDADQLIAEKAIIDRKHDNLKAARPREKATADHFGKMTMTGCEYLALSQKANDTVCKTIDDYLDLVSPPTTPAEDA